jgi:hypothetical protein
MKTHKDIQGWYDWHKLTQRLVMHSMPQGGTYIEVGVWKGKSLVAFGEECMRFGKNAKLYGVDLFGGKQDDYLMDRIVEEEGGSFFGATQKNLLDCNIVATLIRGDSVKSARQFDDESADIILIDALHTYEAVKRDTLAWMPKLKKNGYMLWHDCDREEVRRAVRESWGNNFRIEKPRTGYARKV